MYKEIFRWVITIISQPAKAWVLLAKKKERSRRFLSIRVSFDRLRYCRGFSGRIVSRKEFDLELALKSSIRTLVSSFGGFYLGAYLMNEIWQGIFKREKDLKLWLRFVGYSSSLMFALNIVLMLLPEFFFLRIFILYTFYIVWEGAGPYMGVEEIHAQFVGFTTAIILLTPVVIEILLSMLMPGLSF